MDKRKKAIELLEALQSVYFKNIDEFNKEMELFYKSVDDSLSEMSKDRALYGDDFRHNLIIPESKYQNKYYYNIYLDKIKLVEKTYWKLFSLNPIPTPIFGTIHKSGFYTNIIKDDTTEPVIIISEGLRAFAFSVSKIVSMSLKLVEIDGGMDAITQRKFIKQNIKKWNLDHLYAVMLLEYYFTGQSFHIGIDFPTNFHMYLTLHMAATINYFVLAHEYCHYHLRHFDVEASNQVQTWSNEILADYQAIIVTLNIMIKRVNPTYIIWGIYIFFCSLETFEIYDLAIKGALNFDRHPPIKIRKDVLFKAMNEINHSKQFVDISAFDYMFNLLRYKFSNTIPDIKNMQ